MDPLRVLIVDDEAPARTRLKRLVKRTEGLEMADACADGRSAVETILSGSFDLVLLDMQMPEVSGLEVVKIVGPDRMPPVVFVTAHDEYALRAFEVAALDYLLKPFDDARFENAIERVRERIRRDRLGALSDRLLQLIGATSPDDLSAASLDALSTASPPESEPAPDSSSDADEEAAPYVTRIAIERHDGEVQLVPVDRVTYFEADGSYVNVHTRERRLLIRERMKTLEERLDPAQFCRIHRSTIVNLDHVISLEPYMNGEYKACLDDGTKLKVSRGRKETLEAQLRIL